MIRRLLRGAGKVALWIAIILCLGATVVPHFLDRRYYRGPVSDHFDGERFFNPDGEGEPTPTGRGNRSSFPVRYLLDRDDRPDWPAHVPVSPATPPQRVTGDRMLATWVGHATVLIQTRGLNILTDPMWSDTAGPLGIGPSRVAAPGIRFADLPPIDLVLVSHNHYDHLDLATLRRLWRRDRPRIVTSLGNDSVIRQAGVPSTALDWGGRLRIAPGVELVVTRNHHWGSRWFADRNRALWSGFVVRLPGGNLLFAGDTGFGDGRWADAAASYGPIRLALIPIGAFRFVPGQMASSSHVGPAGAVAIFERMHAARAIGIHWGTFRLSREAYDTPPRLLELAARCAGLGDAFSTVAIGRTVEIPGRAEPAAHRIVPRKRILDCLDTPAARALP
ncbi:MBL fold metallo-hydrolase [Stakelama saccharophila]|uniref:MBL fold metallo-hydrolase n=1 Tax=Stakelama saccharophila TaxID=3075605 RepID=A0ABZ0BCD5_9SPHN|nr:MBL fold metallo-hydrolase [Stakelama sp. W311]WNO54326.1 MBL fold metallo-hydrolase [Stakelama sp. W311]